MTEIRDIKKYFSRIGAAFFAGSLLIFAVQFAMSWLQHKFFSQTSGNYDITLFVSSLSMYVIAMPLLVLLVRRIPGAEPVQHKMKAGKWFIAFFMAYALMYLSNLFGVLTTEIMGQLKGDTIANPLQDVVTGISPLTALVLMVVCAPIIEEYVFRKLIVDRTVQYGEKTAIVLSGLMFALFHGNLNQFVYALVLGMFFAFIYVKTGKLIYSITLHGAINFMGSIPGMLLLKSEVFRQMESVSAADTDALMALVTEHMSEIMVYLGYLALVFVLVIVGIVCWAVNFKKMKCVPAEIVIPKGQRFKTMILNLGMILYSLFWIVQIVKQILE